MKLIVKLNILPLLHVFGTSCLITTFKNIKHVRPVIVTGSYFVLVVLLHKIRPSFGILMPMLSPAGICAVVLPDLLCNKDKRGDLCVFQLASAHLTLPGLLSLPST